MCGIVGYIGTRDATAFLLEGLKRLEYRGYDSAGIAVANAEGLSVRKVAGRIGGLSRLMEEQPVSGSVGIAHTRWATHGAPNEVNAHPHTDCDGTLALIHNGIIENADVLRAKLQELGHTFRSETDTEVMAHLIEEAFEGNLEQAVAAALTQVDGTYGLAVLSSLDAGKIVVARKGSPLVLGIAEDGDRQTLVASDVAAILGHTRKVVYLEDGELAVLRPDGYATLDMNAWDPASPPRPIEKEVSHISWDLERIEKGGFAHFMLKEIHEQPTTVEDAMRGRILEEEGTARLGGLRQIADALDRTDRIVLSACGTSWHAALVAEYMLEEHARIPVEVEYASEFRYRNPVIDEDTLFVAISQSGETADTLAAIREARRRGATTMGIVNVVGSTIARETDGGVYTHSGPEIGVASTKAFTGQLTVLALFTLMLARQRGMSILQGREMVAALRALPDQIRSVLEQEDAIREVAEAYADTRNALYLGRGPNFPVALEGALKLKEISYIHAEGYPAAEMKHGPIALIDRNMPVIVIAPTDSVYSKVLSNVEEVRTRGGRLIGVTSEDNRELESRVDHLITVPHTVEMLQPILTVVPLQLLAYHIAVKRGCDVDQPRNLAKSVTVE
ncbi:MAG: glutamine--fructose-6-phosphate transaminase (isomerizing) [Candidatus Palauibacterales bacterium]|nr:glutamine--fructose-6-phosphate transaminase (isomerizing) [Candidatus Palauibacterales bacterium]MDP2530675.1 glutamine--fructose-6-phosphate transaminase (isomerizing) [Candidatus Palauibacterales bacterium]